MKAVEAAKILEFFRSLPPDAYITRVERARFRDQEITATETMTAREADEAAMVAIGGLRVRHLGRYWIEPRPAGEPWRIVEDVSPGPLPRSMRFEVEWRPATPDEEARARAHHTGRWRS